MNNRLSRWQGALSLSLLGAVLTGCATTGKKSTEAQMQFVAGQEEAFALLQRSGIYVVRFTGPFQRPVLPWHSGMTVAEAILEAGYTETTEPRQILVQRGPTAMRVDPAGLLAGEDIPVEAGDMIHVLP